MRTKYTIELFLFLLISYCEQLISGTGIQYWNREGLEIALKNNMKISIIEELRFQDNASSLYHHFTEAGISFPLKQYFDCSFQYRHIYEKKEDKWLLESRPQINGTIKLKWHQIALKDRNRFEYRIRESADHSWRYRNKLALEFPVMWTVLKLQPFGADEIFFDFSKKTINRNRIYLGLKLKLLKYLKGEIYYLLQSSKETDWINIYIIGTKLQLIF